MKNSHIKIIFLLIFLQLQLFASSYEWKASVNKSSAYTNEVIYLKYICEFSDRGELYAIDFNPVVESELMSVKLLSETTKIVNYKRVSSYEFVAFVHRAGEIVFDFEMVMKKTNRESIEDTVLGRDNGEYEEFTKRYLKQKALHVEIKEAQSSTVGELKLHVESKKAEVKAYEPYNIEIVLDGVANFYDIKPIEFSIEDVKIFSQEPTLHVKLSEDGYRGSWSQKFAFVGESDFEIPSFKFSYFDLQTSSEKVYKFNKIDVSVLKAYTKEELLDEEEYFTFNYEYLYYLLTFIAGFLVSKIKIKRKVQENSQDEEFRLKIEKMNSLDEIVFALILEDSKKYKYLVERVENKEITSLKEVKKLI